MKTALDPAIKNTLLRARMGALKADHPDVIATASIGCLHHTRGGNGIPVRHWVDFLTERFADG